MPDVSVPLSDASVDVVPDTSPAVPVILTEAVLDQDIDTFLFDGAPITDAVADGSA